MIIKEFILISKEDNGTFPQLKCITKHKMSFDEMYLYYHHNNYEFEYLFFGDILKLQNNFIEQCYIMSYDGANNPIGVFKVSSGGKNENSIYLDNIFTYLLLSGSKSFISIHNHPNNIIKKSFNDSLIDNSIKEISELLNFEYKDGLVITKERIKEIHKEIDDFSNDIF